MSFALLLFALLPCGHHALAEEKPLLASLPQNTPKLGVGWPAEQEYVVPNELFPSDGKKIYQAAPEGVFVSVGSERAFIGASVSRGASGILVLDMSPAVVRFIRWNALLLRLSADRADYLRLRSSGPDVWLSRARKLALSETDLSFLSERDTARLARYLRTETASYFGAEVVSTIGKRPFTGVDYREDDALFSRVKSFADADRIRAFQVDWNKPDDIARITASLRASGEKIAAIDLSNAWADAFIERAHLEAAIRSFGPIAHRNALFVVTDLTSSYLVSGIRLPVFSWEYFGFRFRELLQSPKEIPLLLATLHSQGRRYVPGGIRSVYESKPKSRDCFERAAPAL